MLHRHYRCQVWHSRWQTCHFFADGKSPKDGKTISLKGESRGHKGACNHGEIIINMMHTLPFSFKIHFKLFLMLLLSSLLFRFQVLFSIISRDRILESATSRRLFRCPLQLLVHELLPRPQRTIMWWVPALTISPSNILLSHSLRCFAGCRGFSSRAVYISAISELWIVFQWSRLEVPKEEDNDTFRAECESIHAGEIE